MTHLRQYNHFAASSASLFPEISRRGFLRQSAGVALLAACGLPAYASDEPLLLAVNADETRAQRVEVAGQMKMNPTGKEGKYLPMSDNAELNFLQRRLPAIKDNKGQDSAAVRLVRHYQSAETKFNLKNTEFSDKLRDDRQLIVLQTEGEEGV